MTKTIENGLMFLTYEEHFKLGWIHSPIIKWVKGMNRQLANEEMPMASWTYEKHSTFCSIQTTENENSGPLHFTN